MMVDAFAPRGQRWLTGLLSIISLIVAAVASVWLWTIWPAQRTAFNGMIVLDELRLSFTLIFLIVALLTILISSVWIETEKLPAGEFHSLLLFATTGMMLMASAGDLVIVFLGLEILSIATYVLAGFRRTDVRSNESSLKYFILGSFASEPLVRTGCWERQHGRSQRLLTSVPSWSAGRGQRPPVPAEQVFINRVSQLRGGLRGRAFGRV